MAQQSADTLDVENLLTELENDVDAVAEILELFVTDAQKEVTAIKIAAGGVDTQGLRRYAHSLKGGAGNVRARRMHQTAKEIEEITISNRLEFLPCLVERLESEFLAVKKVLKEWRQLQQARFS